MSPIGDRVATSRRMIGSGICCLILGAVLAPPAGRRSFRRPTGWPSDPRKDRPSRPAREFPPSLRAQAAATRRSGGSHCPSRKLDHLGLPALGSPAPRRAAACPGTAPAVVAPPARSFRLTSSSKTRSTSGATHHGLARLHAPHSHRVVSLPSIASDRESRPAASARRLSANMSPPAPPAQRPRLLIRALPSLG